MAKSSLLIGCGHSRERRLSWVENAVLHDAWGEELVTLDAQPPADVIHDLNNPFLPFLSDRFDEIHAYEVLEHLGTQGDVEFFFQQFHEFWRILKPGGYFAATVPHFLSPWAWGDPSHRRVITIGTLVWLQRPMYYQLGKTTMSDFRVQQESFPSDFSMVLGVPESGDNTTKFVLRAEKPVRPFPPLPI